MPAWLLPIVTLINNLIERLWPKKTAEGAIENRNKQIDEDTKKEIETGRPVS